MNKLIIGVVAVAVLAFGLVPAQAATKYVASQKTLASFSSSATGLTTLQRSQVEQAVEANAYAEKFICIGIRYYEQAMSVNITVRKRAKAACDYAKELNPELSTWYQTKPTRARSYAGKVLLTIKTDSDMISSSGNAAPTVEKHRYLDCDSSRVDTRVDSLSQSNVINVSCPEDAQTPAAPLDFDATPSDPSICELTDVSSGRMRFNSLMVGFPRTTSNLESTGNYKITVIPLDWSDFAGKGKPSTVHRAAVDKFATYYQEMSYGKLNLEVNFADQWFRLPGKMADYKVTESDYQNTYSEQTKAQKTRLFHGGVKVSDSSVDFSNTAIVVFVLPSGQTAIDLTLQGFWASDLPSPALSDEGLLKNFFTAGNAFPIKQAWSYYAHEFGHTIMLPDYYLQSGNFGNDALIPIPTGPFSGFDMMSTQGGPSRTMSLWSRWMMNWLSPSNLYCGDLSTLKDTSLTLHPIDQIDSNLKGAIIKISDSKAVVVESRRETKYDEKTTRSRNGVIVYTIDTAINHGEGPMALVPPAGRGLYYPYKNGGGQPQLDAMLYVGNSVLIEGLKITLNSSGIRDIVSISKIAPE
jgi:M6 family metalloprotease-like protein